MEHESDGDASCNWYAINNHKRLRKGTGRLSNQRTSEDHPVDSIIKIGQNTEKCLGDLKRVVVTETPVKDHRLTLV